MPDPKQYWATWPTDELTPKLMSIITNFRKWMSSSGHGARVLKGWRAYHGLSESGGDSSFLSPGGQRNELVKTVINDCRTLVQAILSMTMAAPPAMQPVAANSDAGAREQAAAGRGILEHFHREHQRDALDKEVVETCLAMGEAGLLIEWDASLGEPMAVDPDTQGAGIYEGNFKYTVLNPFDMYRDISIPSWRELPYIITRGFESKWEVAAKFPEKADEIISLTTNERTGDGGELFDLRWARDSFGESDVIPVYKFLHRKSHALPQGSAVTFLNERIWLKSGPLPYEELPVYRITPGNVLGTSLGYTNLFDILGISDVLNALYSAITTNNTKFGVPVIVAKRGSNIDYQHLSVGGGFLEYDNEKPEAINFTATAPEAYKFIEVLEGVKQKLMGVNATSLGNPPGANMAAQALALLDSKTQAFNDGLQQSVRFYRADTATAEIKILQRFATTDRIATVEGKAKNWMLKSFNSEDLKGIDRIAIEPVNATSRTQAGKMAMVEYLIQLGIPLKADQLIDLLNTGQMDSMYEAEETNLLRIRGENELMMEGKPARTLISDTHWLDIPEHLTLLDNPAMREQGMEAVQNAVLDHVQEHLQLWAAMPPAFLAARGGPPLPMPMNATQPPMPGAQSATPPPGPGGTPNPTMPEVPTEPAPPNLPSLPNGEPAQVPGVTQ